MQIEVLPCTEETERSSNQAEEISTSQSSQAQDHRDDGAEIGSSPPPKKRQRKLCSVDKCKYKAISKGICAKHGAVPTCKVEGCSFKAINKKDGVCNAHSETPRKPQKKKQCSFVDESTQTQCTNRAIKGGICVKHGAKRNLVRCRLSGCNSIARSGQKKGGLCLKHMKLVINAKRVPSLSITVSPGGKLGLTLGKIDEDLGGATITAIDSACTFKEQVTVGDRLVTINDNVITKESDFSVDTDTFRKLGVAQKKAIEWVILNEMKSLGENNTNTSTNAENESKIQSVTSQGGEVTEKEVSRGENNDKLTTKRTENKTKAVKESKIQPVTSQGEEVVEKEVKKELDHGEHCNMPADEKLNNSKTTANKAVSKKELQLNETIAKLSKQIIKAAEDEKDLFKKLQNANKLAEALQRENEELKAALVIAKGRQKR